MAVSLTSNGLVMPASASLTGGANTLDDYQEGTDTSIFIHTGSTYSHADQQCHYVKIGKNVLFSCYTSINGSGNSFSGSSGTMQVGGWPFTVLNSSNYFGYTHVGYTYLIGWHKTTSGDLYTSESSHSALPQMPSCRAESNQTKGSLMCGVSLSLNYSLNGASCITNSARLQYGGWYITAS